jgi:outer membrane biosynthesis protein TonB
MSVAKAEQGCSTAKGASFSLFVKLVLFVSFAVAVLFASDVIEFQQTVGVSSSTGASAGITPFVDGKVQQKLPHIENENAQKEIEKDKAIKETDPPKTTPSPTDVPKNPPPTPYPTEKPANQPSDAPETPSPANKLDVPNDAKKSEGDNSTEEKDDQSTTQAEPATAVIHTPTLGAGNPTRHTYKRRGQPMDEEARKAMVDKWGSWTLVDNKERPKDDYYAAFPNRDVPRDKFPANAWQTDTEYLAKFVPEGLKIVTRAYNAILEEYGLTEDDLKFFHVEKLDNPSDFSKPSECLSLGGCTTKRSWENLKRRLLHAIMTEDSFVFAMGGHSSSAGVRKVFLITLPFRCLPF